MERAALALKQQTSAQPSGTSTADVEVEYVSAPREYEDVKLEDSEDGEPASRGGLGSTAGLGSRAGLGSDWSDTPGLGLGATAGLGMTPGPSETPGPGETPGLGSLTGLGFASAQDTQPADSNPYADFERIFSKFASAEEVTGAQNDEEEDGVAAEEVAQPKADERQEAGGQDSDDESGDEAEKASKRKRKMESRLKIAELKQACPQPEVVEVWDVTAQDPRLLVWLKAYRNTVPVPRHWSQKRKYLQGKRGIEKPPFQLPEFIEATGISQMRQAYQEKEEAKKLKNKQREKMQPKMGKLDIDYQVLHDAFFKYQTKPSLTALGELYYEGKEFEARITNAKPGVLSEELRKALGMAEGSPPPWLINMQRYGPPPSYPDLKIPGLNAPIPPGAEFGYHAGGWGKPPVDEAGNPVYGDVFGVAEEDQEDELVDKAQRWGDLESEDEEEEESEEEAESDEEADDESLADGLASVASGYSSLPSGIETPDTIDLRKAKAQGDKQLYTVLEQQAANVGTGTLMGSDHTYVIPGGGADGKERRPANFKRLEMLKQQMASDVEVAIDPEELEGLDDAAIKALYESRLAEQRATSAREDFSDLVAQKAAQQKRKAAERKEAGKAKKQKEFKF
ncbi:hypothetical protein WJX72_005866 [[Myrmecia] bisecta]|uniref:PSP proline-rich domain-containing protein n=1 Tax=[Myrmecia] bisecta TaxID=41462 RepID=A0AAW1Q6Z6_9CHLO